MNKKSIIGIVVGLMIATSTVYFVETSEELFEEQDMIKGPFFLIVAIAYIPVAVWMLKKPNSSIPYAVTIAGIIGVIALYAVTRTDMAAALGMSAGGIGHLGIVSKVLQVGVVIGSVLAWTQARKEPLLQYESTRVRKQ
ncbi:MAG: hypothetical protein OEL56_00295 [Nitrosopumilus sp.]|nr:hypothetical protein [Nitrosopumilus sp.]MDH3515453.1 hypothetical protein [Nitrosopumilus sp.]MDH3564247.1 hypothetical protein [Nitrosopumilus sp.]MDH5416593.1 hypothetical protein [Nitrosopumilus sp.]MDH5555140.1 hypothetical protein [Nitrosopumilus sp.]